MNKRKDTESQEVIKDDHKDEKADDRKPKDPLSGWKPNPSAYGDDDYRLPPRRS